MVELKAQGDPGRTGDPRLTSNNHRYRCLGNLITVQLLRSYISSALYGE
jgi:hypothetical protein